MNCPGNCGGSFDGNSVDTGIFGMWSCIAQSRIIADVIVSGCSRRLMRGDPRPLSQTLGRNVYNIRLNGSQTNMQLAHLKTYLCHNRRSEMVIDHLDIYSPQMTPGSAYEPVRHSLDLDEPDLCDVPARVDQHVWKARYGNAEQHLRFGWPA